MNIGENNFSWKRKKCPDLKDMHKKVIYSTHKHRFVQLKELAALLQTMPEKIIQAEDKQVIYSTHQHRFVQLKELAVLLQLMPEKIIQA